MSVELRKSLFSQDEKAILDEWFNVPRNERNLDLGWYENDIRLDCADVICNLYAPTAAAAAKIVLQSVEQRLPNWVAFTAEGEIIDARHQQAPAYRSNRLLALLPQFLFSIDWSATGPGFSWPMQYHMTWVPGYDQFVVTCSADSPEGNYGYCDLAVDSVAPSENPVRDAAVCIRGDWGAQYAEYDQQHWESFLRAGLISAAQAFEMAESVWGENQEGGELNETA